MNSILLVSSFSEESSGGIGTWTRNFLASNWAKNKEITFFNMFASRKSKKNKVFSFFRDLRKLHSFKKTLIASNPDVVHINFGGSKLGLFRDCLMAKKALKLDKKVFLQCHCDANDYYNNKRCINALKGVYKKGARFIAINPQTISFFRDKIYVNDQKLFYITNFVPSQEGKCKIKDKLKRAIFVGHITKAKGVELIFRLAQKHDDVVFLFVGPVFNDVTVPNFDNIAFAGELNRTATMNKMLDSDILLLPSKSEGLPMVVLEAMSIGLPILASNVGDLSSVLSNTKAGLYNQKQDEEFFSMFESFKGNKSLRFDASNTEIAKFYDCFETEKVLEKLDLIYDYE